MRDLYVKYKELVGGNYFQEDKKKRRMSDICQLYMCNEDKYNEL